MQKSKWNWTYKSVEDMYSLLLYSYFNLFYKVILKRGRKIWAYKFLLKIFFYLKRLENFNPTYIFLVAMLKISPKVMLKSLKLGVNTKMIPAPISIKNQMSFSVKWIIKLIRDQKRRVTVDEIGDLLLWALENKGASWRKKILTYKIAIENRYLLKKYFK